MELEETRERISLDTLVEKAAMFFLLCRGQGGDCFLLTTAGEGALRDPLKSAAHSP